MPFFPFKTHTRSAVAGQGLTEYAVISGLVVLASVSAIHFLGTGINSSTVSMMPEVKEGPKLVSIISATLPAVKEAVSTDPNAPKTDANGPVNFNNGQTVTVNGPNNALQAVQAVGANGTVDMLAGSLETLAGQLVAQGKISQSAGDALVNLANISHRQAAIAAVIDSAMKAAGSDTNAALASRVTFEGKSYSVEELSAQIATGSANSNGSYNYGSEISKLWSSYTGLWGAGAMKDPASAAIIDGYVHEIASLTDSNRVIISKMEQGYGGTPSSFRDSQASYLQSIGFNSTATLIKTSGSASGAVGSDASGICKAGGSTDNGQKCSG